MKYKIFKNPNDYDHDNIEFIGEKYKGEGYIGKKDNNIGLIRCPKCGKENHSMSVSSGVCAWCDFDVYKM